MPVNLIVFVVAILLMCVTLAALVVLAASLWMIAPVIAGWVLVLTYLSNLPRT